MTIPYLDSNINRVILCCSLIVLIAATTADAQDHRKNENQNTKTSVLSQSHKTPKQDKKQTRKELIQLKKLPDRALKAKAKKGDPIARLAMVHQYSAEAVSVVTIPMLANSALEDAIRSYNLAARIGALKSKSIRGTSVPPIRAVRKRR